MVLCPCGTGKEYEACCEPVIQGKDKALTAEALMRSRYSAYALGEVKYLIDSVHPRKRHSMEEKNIKAWSENSTWHGLEIVTTEKGGPDDTEGMVEFIAHYSQGENKVDHREKALFSKEEDRWYFVDGKIAGHEPYVRPEPKIGRNDPCPCGSGKKYKKCCGTNAS
jgi:SEC-C motif domain protein